MRKTQREKRLDRATWRLFGQPKQTAGEHETFLHRGDTSQRPVQPPTVRAWLLQWNTLDGLAPLYVRYSADSVAAFRHAKAIGGDYFRRYWRAHCGLLCIGPKKSATIA